MLTTIYILGGIALYLGIGTKCAKVDIEDSIKNELSKDRVTKNALVALWTWPAWVVCELPRQLFERRVEKRMSVRQLRLESDREVQKLLDSGEIDL